MVVMTKREFYETDYKSLNMPVVMLVTAKSESELSGQCVADGEISSTVPFVCTGHTL
jgi:hypothetical protein